MTNYLLCGGGTGGHVNPMLALAEFIRSQEPKANVLTLGTVEGLESSLVPARGFELLTIDRLPFPRKLGPYAFTFPLKFLKAISQVKRIIIDREIDVVVGFGGYASAPAYLAAKQMRIPYVIHEANALPGMANKMGLKNAAAIGVAFENTKLTGSVFTGMPLRAEIEQNAKTLDSEKARRHFGLASKVSTILVTGGSLGAKRINDAISGAGQVLEAAGIQVIHVTGEKSDLPEVRSKNLVRMKYCHEMQLAMAAADLVVSRAGASTVSEIGAFGIPALYVPYAVGNGEQMLNAESSIESGAAILVEDNAFDAAYVRDQLIPLVSNSKRLKEMAAAAKRIGIQDGTLRLYKLVQSVLLKKVKARK